jgi:hypothetical protein
MTVQPANKRAQLLADDFARNGFKVYVPELFEGDSVPEDAFNPVRSSMSTSFPFTFRACILGVAAFRSHEMAPKPHI